MPVSMIPLGGGRVDGLLDHVEPHIRGDVDEMIFFVDDGGIRVPRRVRGRRG